MKQTKIIMGMPITVEVTDSKDTTLLDDTFDFFRQIDSRYSTYREDSEIAQINNGMPRSDWSTEMQKIMQLCEDTKQATGGYFDIEHNGKLDPSGLVKGWSIWEAAKQLQKRDTKNFYIEAGGDIQAQGMNSQDEPWSIGIRNPFNTTEIIKTLHVHNHGIATSGTYIRGQHIYDPHRPKDALHGVQSLTVIATNVYEADRFATAAFAMGMNGITFIEGHSGLEGYMVDDSGIATYTSGFREYVYA